MKKRSVGKVLLMEAVVIFAAFLFCLFTFRGVWGHALYYFVDIPSMLCLLLLVVPALLVSGMWRDFIRVFSIGKRECTIAQMKRSLEAVKLAQRLVLCGIGFFTVITFVIVLFSMQGVEALGPCLAVIALTVFYGMILEFFLAPMSAHVQNCITDAMDIQELEESLGVVEKVSEVSANAKLILNEDEDEEE